MGRKRIYTFKSTDSSPLYMKNMVLENGINKKRRGWRVLGAFSGEDYLPRKINGIHRCEGEGGLIVHAGEELYKCDTLLNERKKLFCGNASLFKDGRSQGCMCGDTLYFGGLGRLLGYKSGELFSVYEHSGAYVPTTSTSICELHVGQGPKLHQEPNVLTRKRKNTLRAVKSERSTHRFLLDGVVDYNSPFRLKVSFRVKTSADVEDELTSPYIGTDANGEEVNTIVTIEDASPRIGTGIMQSHVKAYDANGREITVNGAEFRWRVLGGRELVLYFHGISPSLYEDNIEVEYSVATPLEGTLDSAEIVASSATSQGENVLLLSCGDNKIYYSSPENGELYFKSSNVITIGNSEAVSAITPMAGGAILIYKRNSCYWLKPQEQGYEVILVSHSHGAQNPFVARALEGDGIAFSGYGVKGIMQEGSGDNQRAQLYERGGGLWSAFDTLDTAARQSSFAVVHKGVYYLFIDGRAFVADPQSAKGSAFEYEWRIFDPCPASCAFSLGDTLYMGRENGEIAVFGIDYKDRERKTLTAKDMDFVLSDGEELTVTVNDNLSVKAGDKISLDTHFAYATSCTFGTNGGVLHIPKESLFDGNDTVQIYVGTEVVLTDVDGELVYQGKIIDVDPSECTVTVDLSGILVGTELFLYVKRTEREKYELVPSDSGYKLYSRGHFLRLYSLEIEQMYIEKEREIECVFCTPITDLDCTGKKTLYQIALTLSEDTDCVAEIGYDTRRNSFSRAVKVGGHFDLDRLDYNRFTFNPKMKGILVIKCLERDFDHIRVKITSSKGEGLGIEGVSVIYTER